MKRITPASVPTIYKVQGMVPTPWKLGERGDKEGCILAALVCNTGIDARGPSTPETIKLLVTRGFERDYLCGLRAGFDGLSILGEGKVIDGIDPEEEHNLGVLDGLQAANCLREAGMLALHSVSLRKSFK